MGAATTAARDRPKDGDDNEQGVATFQWKTSNATATSTVRLSEELQDGYVVR